MTTIESFFATAARLGPRLAWKHGDREFTWAEAAQNVRRTAGALVALGVEPGDAVCIVGPNTPEWLQVNLGALAAGAVPAPIYPTLTAEQARYIARHSGARVTIVSDATQAEKLSGAGLEIVLMSEWEKFLARGNATHDAEVDRRLRDIKPSALATLIYTSGTTGPPKAVMLSHQNLAFSAEAGQRIGRVTDKDVLISYLPLSHIAEQMITVHGPTLSGASVWFCDVLENAPHVMRAARPTIFFGVPRVWEKIQARIQEQIQKPVRRALVRLFPALLRKKLGLDRARILVTGAAKMNLETLKFFDSFGLPILDMWGMSESTAMGAANLPAARRPGTVGRKTEGVELRIAPDGEILTRGPHVFLGYFKDPQATAEAIDAEGFLHTGDVGEFDEDGYLKITDRKKDLLITSGGKNVSPQNIELLLGAIRGVAHAVVVGDARKYLAALIVPEKPDDGRDPTFIARVGREIESVNARLAQYETIKKFKVLPAQFSIESGELTPTMKLKRKAVSQKYAREIEELFAAK